MDQDSKVSYVIFTYHLGDDHLYSINNTGCCRFGEIVKQPHLLGCEFPGEHVRDEIMIGPLFSEPCGG